MSWETYVALYSLVGFCLLFCVDMITGKPYFRAIDYMVGMLLYPVILFITFIIRRKL